jgi:uncharacterized protein (DUF2132 family)
MMRINKKELIDLFYKNPNKWMNKEEIVDKLIEEYKTEVDIKKIIYHLNCFYNQNFIMKKVLIRSFPQNICIYCYSDK